MTTLYLDENFRSDAVAPLEARGHIVFTTPGEGRQGKPDPDQLLYAVQHGWLLVTNNREDFQLLHIAWTLWGVQPPYPGILALDQGPLGERCAAAIDALLSTLPVLENTLYNWSSRDNSWSAYVPR